MLLASALKGVAKYQEALREGSASNPSYISENAYRLTQYLSVVEEELGKLESELEEKESASFAEHIKNGKSMNASKESVRREFTKERSTIIKITRTVSSCSRLISQSQSRVKHLIAEANNQI